MQVAILGAGFSGLAVAWHLFHLCSTLKITIFDPKGIGGGASGVSGGLLYPYAGASAKLNWRAWDGWNATNTLLKSAEKALGKPVSCASGLLRLAITREQRESFFLCTQRNPDVIWQTEEQCQQRIPAVGFYPGIWIPSSISVYPQLYLQGLWKCCQTNGAVLEKVAIASLEEVKQFDCVVVATGAHTHLLPGLEYLPITPIKGQTFDIEWPSYIPPLPVAVNSQAYMMMDPNGSKCLVGATYERMYSTEDPIPEVALQHLVDKIQTIAPSLNGVQGVNFRAGIRASTPDHRPISMRLNAHCWVLTGMGSKGLLYHSLYAQSLAQEMMSMV